MKRGGGAVRIVIVDDEPLARRRVRTLLGKHPELRIEIVGEAANGAAAIRAVAELSPDLLLLDIQMPGKDGFDVLKEIRANDMPGVVFITAHDEHAVRAFDVQALDYLLKPINEERLLTAIRRAIARLAEMRRGDLAAEVTRLLESVDRSRREGRLAVKTDRGTKLIPVADIQWVESDADLVKIHTARGTLVHRATMTELESELPAGDFARVHRGAIVNVNWINEIQPMFKGDYVIVLKTGAAVRTSRTYRARVQALMGRP